ncbi:hypothetical protein KIN20_008036 [Parelaphostrongylus tenuis]|uniref:Saposin B-type domain-containing protein n=1 Tax=Parelaphostrongylus tenuis TaxID=148309 RepID=A0AAD5M472_PARTN|nr:hypothetical protein KIN20_008036 [Parelaphostrongylus tenuis]
MFEVLYRKYMLRVRIALLLALAAFMSSESASVGMTCSMCKSELTSINEKIQSSSGLASQLGGSVSQGCEELEDESEREDCRKALNDHFSLIPQACSN